VQVEIAGREVAVGGWRYRLKGVGGGELVIMLLDTDLQENDASARAITDQLYGGDQQHRLEQELVLGIGGLRMLEDLGYPELARFHMNEGHSALLALALLEAQVDRGLPLDTAIEHVRSRCVFTTHTPVPAGHDRFDTPLVAEVLGPTHTATLDELDLLGGGSLNMTELGLALSGFVNAVSLRHREVTRAMFPSATIRSVTNGVHVGRWAAPPLATLFDRRIPGWRSDNAQLHYATELDLDELDQAHRTAKAALIAAVRERTSTVLDPDALTIGLARRATPYKQTALLFSDLDRLGEISATSGPLQILCSGKAHPQDAPGKALIARVIAAQEALRGTVSVVFLEDYDLELASLLVAGSDLWLNTPIKPHEASGTSGMKAALNGVPSLSVLDGWWIEGCVEGVTGWAVGDDGEGSDADLLYDKLGRVVAPLFRFERRRYLEVMRHAIALNGSFFNTERMAREYALSAYGLGPALLGYAQIPTR
jgi:starch phosphorylase